MKDKINVNNLLNDLAKEEVKYENRYRQQFNKGNYTDAQRSLSTLTGLSIARSVILFAASEPSDNY